ncbi:hypothetical protein AAFF_G00335540 [Aldrovandia affinis]|uniref:Uncharacterized protein n=1 Tax=Aldrovandia affinis TaxID=143900 RepID=A0AAD7SNC7_9TELE|nr:hypothetical protein AAFF_G00335540 [Aldrovandia affinis]
MGYQVGWEPQSSPWRFPKMNPAAWLRSSCLPFHPPRPQPQPPGEHRGPGPVVVRAKLTRTIQCAGGGGGVPLQLREREPAAYGTHTHTADAPSDSRFPSRPGPDGGAAGVDSSLLLFFFVSCSLGLE